MTNVQIRNLGEAKIPSPRETGPTPYDSQVRNTGSIESQKKPAETKKPR